MSNLTKNSVAIGSLVATLGIGMATCETTGQQDTGQPHGAEVADKNKADASPEYMSDTTDLAALYDEIPSAENIARIQEDFQLRYLDVSQTGEQWPEDYEFNRVSTDPSKIVIISKLNVLMQQKFSEPLPFLEPYETLYDWLNKNVATINLRLDCRVNHAGSNGTISLNRNASTWDGKSSSDCTQSSRGQVSDSEALIGSLSLFVHEARHLEQGDPGHQCITERGAPGDTQLEGGSGYAYAALYAMWTYKYGLGITEAMRERAKSNALVYLNRICSEPKHSDPKVQAIVDELLGG